MATFTLDIRIYRDETDGDIDRARDKAREIARSYLGDDRDPDDWNVVTEPDGWEFRWKGDHSM